MCFLDSHQVADVLPSVSSGNVFYLKLSLHWVFIIFSQDSIQNPITSYQAFDTLKFWISLSCCKLGSFIYTVNWKPCGMSNTCYKIWNCRTVSVSSNWQTVSILTHFKMIIFH